MRFVSFVWVSGLLLTVCGDFCSGLWVCDCGLLDLTVVWV